jgi:tRNA(Arg) A34 adenosine deaminase TadA
VQDEASAPRGEAGAAQPGSAPEAPAHTAPQGGPSNADRETFMRAALDEARKALAAGEVPVGAVLTLDGRIIARGYNQPISATDPTAHAEVVVLRQAAKALGNYRLTDTVLYVTVEPCLMCAGALVHARVREVVYGAPEPRSGAVVSAARALETPGLNHRVTATGGVLEDECRALIQTFFREKRGTSA